ncbi:hypothetical protein BCR34DRAFT_607832 [Clohesyomyces aquaticus]|uniref:Ubiquitin-like domain-containing protein n=1 Tax=Clohesyomyces aquaticus TaxID=1231657 RepID=A0A1Y1YCV9_9PLEO|nr:hypothetical protein BCR34DRAFT_607832 [Clohesyomyces aquaticus]
MATPVFGFSVGDFIAGVKLVKDLIESLDDAVGAKPAFRCLIAELRSLEGALAEVKNLEVDPSQVSSKLALEHAASQCQHSIEAFLGKHVKFQIALGEQASGSTWRTTLRKVQWAVCKQDVVDKFRAEITGHVLTINTLLATVHLSSTTLLSERAKTHHATVEQHNQRGAQTQSLIKQNNDILKSQADLILTISQTVTGCTTRQQADDLRAIMLKVLATNMQIYRSVLDIHKINSTAQIPPQIERQLPVTFEDAHGRLAPLHVEFINSWDAFQAVLEVRFRDLPGLKKVQNREYSLSEPGGKRNLGLNAPFESSFLPGRRISMSMIFETPQPSISVCPGCNTRTTHSVNEERQCANFDCRLWYRLLDDIDEGARQRGTPQPQRVKRKAGNALRKRVKRLKYTNVSDQNDIGEDSGDEDTIDQFRRVIVILSSGRQIYRSGGQNQSLGHDSASRFHDTPQAIGSRLGPTLLELPLDVVGRTGIIDHLKYSPRPH